jgi:lipoprotein-releasing system permease protein
MAGQAGRISQIAVKLFDVAAAQSVATELGQSSTDRVQSWDQANANFLQIFTIQDIFRAFITFGILIVVAFGIYNVLTIIVNQKKREIAILQSLGFPPRTILQLFFYQAAILGVVGSVLGLVVGYGVCVWLVNLDLNMMGRRGFLVSFDSQIYWTGFFISTLSCVVAGLLPARAASKLTPIEIIRMDS